MRGMDYTFAVLNEILKGDLAGVELNAVAEDFERKLDGFESMNLDENLMIKIKSLYEMIPTDLIKLKQTYLVIIKRMVGLYFLLRMRSRQLK